MTYGKSHIVNKQKPQTKTKYSSVSLAFKYKCKIIVVNNNKQTQVQPYRDDVSCKLIRDEKLKKKGATQKIISRRMDSSVLEKLCFLARL
jgi:hypothetical protein